MGIEFVIGLSTGDGQIVAAVGLMFVTAIAATYAVGEARRTRKQAIRPVLALDLVSVGGLYVELGIANIGQGAAVDVDVELAFLPGDDTHPPVRHPWQWPLIQPGQRYLFGPPDIGGKRRPNFGEWAPIYSRVELTGKSRDQSREPHFVNLTLTDLPALRDRAVRAKLAGVRQTSAQRDTKAIATSLGEISARLGHALTMLARPTPGDE